MLELLSQAEHGLSLQELCDRLDMKPPTMHNLLRTLAGRGFVDKTRKPVRYRLGSAPQALVQRQARRSLLSQVEAMLPRLVWRLPVDQVLYAEAVGGEVLAVRRVNRSQPGLVQRPGHSPLSPYSSASALVFQANWPADQRDAYRRRYPFEEYGGGLWSSEAALEVMLTEVRRLGYAVPPPRGDTWRLAVPVMDPAGQVLGALGAYQSVGSDLSDEQQRQCIDAMLAGARELMAPPASPRGEDGFKHPDQPGVEP